jgi:hypothetical protein
MAYNPNKDVVAGRTAAQIERAKRMAVGGKRKRCVKGKSCSATCIAANKICMVDIPWAAAKGIPKVVSQIKKVSTATKAPSKGDKPASISPSTAALVKDAYNKKWAEAWKGMVAANNKGDKQSYDSYKKTISDIHSKLTAKGLDVGPLKIFKWDGGGKKVVVVPSVKPSTKPSVKPSVKPEVSTKPGTKPARLSAVEWDVIKKTEKKLKEEIDANIKYQNWKGGIYRQARENIIAFNQKLKNEGVSYQMKVPPSAKRLDQLSKAYDNREAAILSKLKQAISKNDKAAFDKEDIRLQNLYNKLGKKLGKVNKTADIPWEAKVSTKDVVVAKGKAPALPKMTTDAEFKKIAKDTDYDNDTKAIDFHMRAKRILDKYNSPDSKSEGAIARNAIAQKMGGEKAFDAAIKGIKEFTGSDYTYIRMAQHAAMKGEPLKSHQQERLALAKRMEKLLSLMPKEKVVKYRGIRVNNEALNDMIESAKLKGNFVDGGLASWSTALPVAARFADMTTWDQNNRVVFRTVNKRGVGVEGITSITSEMEVLTPGTAKFKHTGNYRAINYLGNTYHVFDVVES